MAEVSVEAFFADSNVLSFSLLKFYFSFILFSKVKVLLCSHVFQFWEVCKIHLSQLGDPVLLEIPGE